MLFPAFFYFLCPSTSPLIYFDQFLSRNNSIIFPSCVWKCNNLICSQQIPTSVFLFFRFIYLINRNDKLIKVLLQIQSNPIMHEMIRFSNLLLMINIYHVLSGKSLSFCANILISFRTLKKSCVFWSKAMMNDNGGG